MAYKNIPAFVLNEVSLFPSLDIRLDFDESFIRNVLEISERYFDSEVFICFKENPLEENKTLDDLLSFGVIAKITMKLSLPNRKLRIGFHGLKRASLISLYEEEGVLHAKTQAILAPDINAKEEVAYIRMLKNMMNEYIQNISLTHNNLLKIINEANDLDSLTDILAFTFNLNNTRKQEYLLELNQISRAKMLIQDIRQDFEIIALEKKIDEEVENRLNKNQKEFILREKIKVIKEELGEVDGIKEISKYREKLNNLDCKHEIYEKIDHEIKRLEAMQVNFPEVVQTKNYIELMLDLPWSRQTEDVKNLSKIEEALNENHHGLEEVKSRILEYIAVKNNTNNGTSPILCLVGPPGVGKTTLAKSVANALNRKYAKISVGGIQDEADIVGHRRTYIGALPGLIIQGMKKAGTINPVFIIDEIDKMMRGRHGDPASSLLEVLDKEQNDKFVDHYVEEAYDLSQVFFITTANYIEQIPLELLDRLEVIELSSYTEYEKVDILMKHIIPKSLDNYNLKSREVAFSKDACLYIIRKYTKESGVREIERLILKILRKRIKEKMLNPSIKQKKTISVSDVKKYLGKEIFDYEKDIETSSVGVVNGLSYTPYGGDTLRIEATIFKGSGRLELTGSLGEVMQESAYVCLSYIKANNYVFGINMDKFCDYDIHIHAEEGAIKKEGPSAGVSLTTVLLSVLTNTKIPNNIAMTGEMTLRGKVLPIGGVREKVIGAHKEHIKKIFLPKYNERDLDEVPDEVKKDIEFIFVDTYLDIYNELFKQKKKNSFQGELIQLDLYEV